ncbi:MAG: DUF1549 domain-containing protein, partial [Pirellulaceae bacterium]|nr:DUF1549 domain-containing protein [Pirellulaceae bacterium]
PVHGALGEASGGQHPVRAGRWRAEEPEHGRVGGRTRTIEVIAEGTGAEHPVSFNRQVVPLLSSLGCSDIRCHGAPSGKGGFRLSLWGSSPEFDHEQLVRDAQGRRTDGIYPDRSLLLRKPLLQVPHVGGKRLESGGHAAAILERWQQEGLVHDMQSPGLRQLQVTPTRRVLQSPHRQQQLAVEATYEDGQIEDVTRRTAYQSSDLAIADVDRQGRVVFHQQGEVAILCRFMGHLTTVRLIHISPTRPGYRWPDPEATNFVDDHVFTKLRLLNLPPSEVCSDADFIRRVTLDLCGLLPTPSETATFVASIQSDKRERLVDELLHRSEFTDYWAKKWLDVLRVSRDSIQWQGAHVFQAWMQEQVRRDRPLSETVTDMLTSLGESYKTPPANYFCVAPMPREVNDPDYLQKDLAESTAQLFLGIRLQCAQCHNHPFERWTQDDYLGLAAFFSQVQRTRLGKAGPSGRPDRRQIAVQLDPAAAHLASEENRHVAPHFPGQPPLTIENNTDLRRTLAAWMTGPENPYFAR